MAVIDMRVSILLAILLLNGVSATSDVTGSSASTELPNQNVPRGIDDTYFYNKPVRNYEPMTHQTEITTSYQTTEPVQSRNRYTIDYQEALRRGRSDVTIQLLPQLASDKFISERLQIAIEYNKKIRRIRKIWGGKVKLIGNTVYFTTDIVFSVSNSIHSFGYTIDYRGRGSSKNYPVYMEVRSADEF